MERGSRRMYKIPGFISREGFSKRAREAGKCIETGQCYLGDNPATDCCIGKVTNSAGDIASCTQATGFCNMCTQVATKAVTLAKSEVGKCTTAGATLCVASVVGG